MEIMNADGTSDHHFYYKEGTLIDLSVLRQRAIQYSTKPDIGGRLRNVTIHFHSASTTCTTHNETFEHEYYPAGGKEVESDGT